MVSIRTISEETNYSVATVSEALRNTGRVRPETRKKILEAAERLGYQRNPFIGDVMSRMRRSQATNFRGTVAVLESRSFHEARKQSRWHKDVFKGARNRAEELGFKLDFFQFDETRRSLTRMHQVLYTRGINGIFLPPFAHSWNLDGIDWNCFSTVQLDYGLENVRMHTVMPDHHASLQNSLKRLEAMGYRRPGLFVERFQDERIMLKWLAGYEAFVNKSSLCERVPAFEPGRLRKENFLEWFYEFGPDLLIGHQSDVIDWLAVEGIEVPEDIGFFSLNIHHTQAKTAGLNLQPELIGAAAIDVLISQIHLRQRGVPRIPYTSSLEGEWVDGFTIRQQ